MRFWMTTSAIALATVATAPVFAQDTAAPAAAATATDEPGDIVVTAQKRSERLQDVPVAVTVISGDALAAQGKVSLEGATVPGRQRAHHITRVPLRELGVVGAHRVTPFSCKASRSARNP
jgi:outer membrane receptor protein involved in Fe transport